MATEDITTTVHVAPTTTKDAHTPDSANYTRNSVINVKSNEVVHGRTTDFHSERKSDITMDGEFDNHVMDLVNGVLKNRQDAEDLRAYKRNENRMITLIAAMLIGIFVTYSLGHDWYGMWVTHTFGPYNFVITIMFDSALALYSLIKKY